MNLKSIFIFFFCVLANISHAQIFINELDSDSPGIDNKEFVEIRTLTPNTTLNGYCLVFFNGNAASSTANQSYHVIDLSSLTTDVNGIATIGNVGVSPVPDLILADNIIQNGEDAIAIYQANPSSFQDGTLATTTNLVNALAYDTSDPDAVVLMALLGITAPQMDENENSLSANESIQRKNNGDYEVKLPTPGAMNDGSGFIYNGIQIQVNTNDRNEGDSLHITFKTHTPVLATLNFNFTLNNAGGFTTADYTGSASISIPLGDSIATAVITTIDDMLNEGDEVLKVKFSVLPVGYNRLNDNIEIRILDNDFVIDPWGPPTLPTYGIVQSTAPAGYYNSIDGLAGLALKQALQDIIADSTIIHAHNYGDIFTILNECDRNPKNSNQVWLMYVETPRSKLDVQSSGSGTGKWNREHIFPQSRGGFANGTSDIPDGINIYVPSNANDLLAGHADAHHLRAEDATENSTRNNKDYGQDYNGPTGNAGSWKGDVARSLFYMCVRYNGLDLVAGNSDDTTKFKLGDLDSLLAWNNSDPRDDFEMNRNNYIYTWQKNRNPFIDLPDLASYLWGTNVGQPYNLGLYIKTVIPYNLKMYPNPSNGKFFISGQFNTATMQVFDLFGKEVYHGQVNTKMPIYLNVESGIYCIKLKIKDEVIYTKIQIN
jgi:hypothetical protein